MLCSRILIREQFWNFVSITKIISRNCYRSMKLHANAHRNTKTSLIHVSVIMVYLARKSYPPTQNNTNCIAAVFIYFSRATPFLYKQNYTTTGKYIFRYKYGRYTFLYSTYICIYDDILLVLIWSLFILSFFKHIRYKNILWFIDYCLIQNIHNAYNIFGCCFKNKPTLIFFLLSFIVLYHYSFRICVSGINEINFHLKKNMHYFSLMHLNSFICYNSCRPIYICIYLLYAVENHFHIKCNSMNKAQFYKRGFYHYSFKYTLSLSMQRNTFNFINVIKFGQFSRNNILNCFFDK